MNEFIIKWDTEVKEVANKCVNWDFIKLVQKGEQGSLSEEESAKYQELGENLKDPYGMWYISDMIWKVEHALADNHECIAKLAISHVYSVISDESYWKNLFNNEILTDEAKNIKALELKLKEIL